jgi:GTP cyclohydrolase I
MYKELFSPPANNLKAFDLPPDAAKRAGIVLLRHHRAFGVCPHHLLPFEMSANVAYIPGHKVFGLSKLARAVESQLSAPILQEELTQAIVDMLVSELDPKAAGCVIAGVHGCMRCRGVKSTGDVVTSNMYGQFLLNPAAREELFQLIGDV